MPAAARYCFSAVIYGTSKLVPSLETPRFSSQLTSASPRSATLKKVLVGVRGIHTAVNQIGQRRRRVKKVAQGVSPGLTSKNGFSPGGATQNSMASARRDTLVPRLRRLPSLPNPTQALRPGLPSQRASGAVRSGPLYSGTPRVSARATTTHRAVVRGDTRLRTQGLSATVPTIVSIAPIHRRGY